MTFRHSAKALIGKTIQVQMDGSTLIGSLSSVGTDILVMRVRIRNRIRRVIVRIAEILFLFALI